MKTFIIFVLAFFCSISDVCANDERWAIVGDSILAQGGSTTSVPAYIQEKGIDVVNLTSSGAVLTPSHSDIAGAIIFSHGWLKSVDRVVIALGTNDWAFNWNGKGFKAGQYYRSYINLLEAVPSDISVTCITPIVRAGEDQKNVEGKYLWQYRVAAIWACNKHNAQVVDGMTFASSPIAPLFSDGLHLTAQGRLAYTDWLYSEIISLGN